jgi:signal transduction histidine kinase
LASLLTALFILDFSLIFLSIFLNEIATDGYQYYIYGQLWKTTVIILNYLLVITTYTLYYKKIPGRVWWLFCCMLVSILLVWTVPAFWQFSPVVLVLLWFEVFRIIFLGIRYHRSGFWILLTGQLAQFLFFHFFINNTFHLFDLYKFSIIQETGRFISNLLNPLTFALQLAWEFGSSNRSLQKKLSEVEVLSAENILKEQEKQQLLASQNEQLETQVSERTESLKRSLDELRSTQSQLIQKEKMASLGELTAGIAHEIQNPLNFVNNFSEVNKEILEELKAERLKPKAERDENLQDDILNDVIANEEKINHHGKRADAIVKGMLQHSQSSTGVKEPTDINKLADEYLRLSYHGLRAKDNSFNATLKTDFDESIGNINIVPQDIGRVLLNLFNNAFYATNQKQKELTGEDLYIPTVTIVTKKLNDKIEIHLLDNGNGIPQKIVEKIFQPFFTTKPTGQGTGLGLSLSYDIVKAHGGEIKINTKEGEMAEFIILLPSKTTE